MEKKEIKLKLLKKYETSAILEQFNRLILRNCWEIIIVTKVDSLLDNETVALTNNELDPGLSVRCRYPSRGQGIEILEEMPFDDAADL